MELGGPLHLAPPIVTQGSDSPFELDYLKAVTAGRAVKRFNRAGKFHVSKWTGPHNFRDVASAGEPDGAL